MKGAVLVSSMLLLAGSAGVFGAAPQQDPRSGFRASCGTQGWNAERCAQLRAELEKQGAAAVPVLMELLGDPDFNVAAQAASALGNMGVAAAPAVPGLVKALGHDHGLVTQAAVASLAILAPQVPAVLPPLISIVEAIPRNNRNIKQSVIAGNALDTLEAIGPPAESAIPALLSVLATMKANPYNYTSLPHRAASALEKIGAAKDPALARASTYAMDPKIEAALARYEANYKAVAASDVPSTDDVVRLYNSFSQLHAAFGSSWWSGDDREYRRIEARAPGVTIWSDELVAMIRNFPFFKSLADRTRDPEAVQLFMLLQDAYPGSLLFCHDRVSDYGWCTRFGDGKFVDFYARWSDFHPANAAAREVVRAEQAAIIEAMKASCVCAANAEPLIREYGLFLARFPDIPAAEGLRKRLAEIRSGSAGIRFQCTPG